MVFITFFLQIHYNIILKEQGMKKIFKIICLIFILIFLSACGNKQLTIKSLQPSQLGDKKVQNIIVEQFKNDKIHQADNIETILENYTINGKRVFELKNTYKNTDIIISGNILESDLDYNFYYDDETYTRCYDGKNCREYIRYIPCEIKNFYVKTKIKILDKNKKILFLKIYTKKDFSDKCYRYRTHFGPMFYNFYKKEKEKQRVNSQLSYGIAKDVIKDIAPHYIYEKIDLIEDLEKNYNDETKKEFEKIVKLLDEKNLDIAQEMLIKLNDKLNYKSYEVLYNLALISEKKGYLQRARMYYHDAKKVCKNIDNLKLINSAIKRVNKNIKNKVKATSQLS
jgi:hypothetical protein